MSTIAPRILVVEDDKVIRAVFSNLLPEQGYRVEMVEDAESGFRLLSQDSYDLVISDIVLPGMDGIEFLRRIKEQFPDLDVILMTAYADIHSVLAAVEAGVYDYLIKPFDNLNEVLHKIARALDKHRIVKENQRLIEYLRQANSQVEGMNRELEAKVEERTKQLADANVRLQQLTLTDDVTDLYNQRFLHQRLEDEFRRATRYGHGLAVLMIDLDNFKSVNDTRDHLFGSRVLRRIGDVLKKGVRNIDVVIRYGGDEFVVILPHTRLQAAVPVAQRLRRKLMEANIGDAGEEYHVTASCGVAVLGDCEAKDTQALLRAADKALYLAKAMGRNRVAVMNGQEPVGVVA